MSGITARFATTLGEFSLDVELQAPAKGVTALFGHSGSGKTTLLRCIAGLERAAEAHLEVNGELWERSETRHFIPTHRRPLGYVFQEASLFPHLSVRRNLEFGMKRIPAQARRVVFEQAAELVGITHLLERSPARLSGGERQRVAIARALLTSPRLLLMDEPLSALDDPSKQEILPYLERLHDELAIPVLYVSHSLKEVARLADHMVWLEGGRVRAAGPLQQVISSLELSRGESEDAGAVVETVVAAHDDEYQLTALDSRWGRSWVRRLDRVPGERVRIRLPARDVSLGLEAEEANSILNVWRAEIESITELEGHQVMIRLRCPTCGDTPPILARITRRSRDVLGLVPGMSVYVRIKSVGLMEG